MIGDVSRERSAAAPSPSVEPELHRRRLPVDAGGGPEAIRRGPANMAEVLTAACRAHPQKEALVAGERRYSFDELQRLGSGFACHLVSLGVERGDRVAFCAPKSGPLAVAILGCLKAGGVYVPVDTTVPLERLLFILDDVRPRVVVAGSGLRAEIEGRLAAPARMVEVERLDELFGFDPRGVCLPSVGGEDLAYCLYTSGSTGRPKGVPIEHGAVAAFYDALAEVMPLDSTSRCMNTSELYFDVHVMDLFYPLHRGATVHLTTAPVIADRLLRTIETQRITHFTAVGPIMTLMSEGSRFERCDLSSLVRVMTGAEILNVDTVQRWLRKVPGLSLVNGYGPTEATVICTAHVIDRIEPGRSAFYPIGRPMKGTRVLLLDGDRVVTEPGVEGELLLSGRQVMKAYWNNEQQTREKLVEVGGQRYYRSGDICTWSPGGELEYVGRNDEQVKVSGFRINLNEVKRVLDAAPMVREGHPITLLHASLGKVIAACFTVSDRATGEEDTFRGLQAFFKRSLPYYMVPSLYFLFDEFPQLPSGKTDKKVIAARAGDAVENAGASTIRFLCRRPGEAQGCPEASPSRGPARS